MPEPAPAPKPKAGKPGEIGGFPWYVWALVLGGGLLIGWMLLRRDKATGSAAGAPNVSPDVLGAQAGQPSTNAAPADNLSPDVLAALGITAGTVGSLGEALANVAIGAQYQLGYISATALEGSFGLAGKSFDFAGQVLGAHGGGAQQAWTTDTTPRGPYFPVSPSTPVAASGAVPSARDWIQQPGFYESANIQRVNPVRGVTATAV